MSPITEIIYNYEYAKRLYRGDEHFEDVWQRILRVGNAFEQVYEACVDVVLASIEKYSGFDWADQEIDDLPIYMVASAPSFVQPFTLSINEDAQAMLEDFIYQLVHRNMFVGFQTLALQERCIRLVADHIMYDLKLKELREDEWDLRRKSIKEYLKR